MKVSELKQLIEQLRSKPESMRASDEDWEKFQNYINGLEGVTDEDKNKLFNKPGKDLDVYIKQYDQDNFEKEDVERLLRKDSEPLKENKMKRSELKQLIKEEILKEMAITEMAMFFNKGTSGLKNLNDLGKKIKAIVNNRAYKDLDPLNSKDDLKKLRDAVKGNKGVKDLLDSGDDVQTLHQNQLNNLIKFIKGEEKKGRGRTKGGKNKPKDEKK